MEEMYTWFTASKKSGPTAPWAFVLLRISTKLEITFRTLGFLDSWRCSTPSRNRAFSAANLASRKGRSSSLFLFLLTKPTTDETQEEEN